MLFILYIVIYIVLIYLYLFNWKNAPNESLKLFFQWVLAKMDGKELIVANPC